MTPKWKSADQAQMVTRFENDPRPAWLWPAEGKTPIWRNRAALLFGARLKGGALKTFEDAAPVGGQIPRILRLGLVDQPILSRMQFLAGRKPLSATCHCTPMRLADDVMYLLVVGVDPIAQEIMDAAGEEAAPELRPEHEHEPLAEPEAEMDAVAPEAVEPVVEDEPEPAPEAEPEPASEAEPEPEAEDEPTVEGLTALVDRLAGHEHLFDPLDAEDDAPLPVSVPGRDYAAIAYDEGNEQDAKKQSDWDIEDPFAVEEAAFAADGSEDVAPERAGLWKVTGKGLTLPRATYEEPESEAEDEAPGEPAPEDEPISGDEPAPDTVEQVSRYNFEELSRILTDRVGREEPVDAEPAQPEPAPPPAPERPANGGALVALPDEALVLNRLPIGILIFRDQDILFANRALVDLTGYENVTTLRGLGLAAIFPSVDGAESAGPVTHLVRKDGERVAVSARLNSVTWQGRPSFMLSARTNEIEPLREAEVGQFAALWAKITGMDFVTADRAGTITGFTQASGSGNAPAEGAPLGVLVAPGEQAALRQFLALPARYAGGTRPAIALKGARPGQTLTLFAEGRAGIISGYFGMIGPLGAAAAATPKGGLPAAALGRITRGLRRPLNTIAGFSELIASEAFGPLANARYLEYARDIRSAGTEIADLADELDDYVRLAEGEMAISPSDVDIATLLADCLVRVRGQASKERVLLRSAISERLPHVQVDAATLKQAVLNMLASAISEAGEGNKVVLSAQLEEDGAVCVHVRDAAKAPGTLAERFVVFRDGVGPDGAARRPSQSSIGLTLTRSLVAVNACSLTLDPASESGTLMTLTIPASLVVSR